MYTLFLTRGEQQAFDWVGDRYRTGEELSALINDSAPDHEWSSEDYTFEIPEYIAWQMRDIAEEEGYSYPCFDSGLSSKLDQFFMEIV